MCWSTISTNLLFYPKWCNFLTLVTFVVKKIVKRMHFGTVNPWVITWIYICEMAMNQLEKQDFWDQNRCPGWGSNSRPSDYETDALPTALPRLQDIYGQNVYSAPLCFLLMQNGYTHGGTRTPNLRFRRPTPYPLGHAGIGTGGAQRKNVHK